MIPKGKSVKPRVFALAADNDVAHPETNGRFYIRFCPRIQLTLDLNFVWYARAIERAVKKRGNWTSRGDKSRGWAGGGGKEIDL